MLSLRRGLTGAIQRFSTSASYSALDSYKAVNEPILGYEAGSKERAALEVKLKEYDSKVHEIPVVIGDKEYTTDDVRYQVKPYDHQNKLARSYYADGKLLKKAIDVGMEAHDAWEKTPIQERAEIFLRAADLLTGKYRMDIMAATMLGQGKTIVQAEIDASCELPDFWRFNVEWGLNLLKWKPISTSISKNSLVYRGMEGFWAAVAPFNFTAISGHLAGAPAFMGNVVLWKSSSTAILSSYLAFKCLREAGLPPGVINFVPSTGVDFGAAITNSPHLAGVNFTGSVPTFENLWKSVGDNISLYNTFPRLIGECGGKNYHFMHPSGDALNVINGTIRAAFEYSGQKCSACARLYVPESRWGEVKDGLLSVQKQLKLGSVLEFDTFLTACIDAKAYKRIKSYIDEAKTNPNLTILAGGKCDDSVGYYVEPTIIQTTDPKDKIMEEEIFGPILSVYVYKDSKVKETMELIGSTSPFALTGAIYAEDTKVIKDISDTLRYSIGNFYINEKATGSVVSQQPFGGARKSGTNDKAGGPHYLLRFSSPLAIKETNTPLADWSYPYMKS